jgi:hypothetical protein
MAGGDAAAAAAAAAAAGYVDPAAAAAGVAHTGGAARRRSGSAAIYALGAQGATPPPTVEQGAKTSRFRCVLSITRSKVPVKFQLLCNVLAGSAGTCAVCCGSSCWC